MIQHTVILCGPPRSGKSCLREGLKQAVMKFIREVGIDKEIYPYVITACPDGEGSWYQSTVNLSPEAAAIARSSYKSKFTPAFVQRVAMGVAACTEPLTFVDIGGFPSEENRAICSAATHAILLAGDMSLLEEWRQFCADLRIQIMAEIHSDYFGTEDRVEGVDSEGVLRGSVHHLERGEQLSERPMIIALSQYIVSHVKGEKQCLNRNTTF